MCRKGERLRSIDIFGAPIGVTFNRMPNFKTSFGGLVTLILIILLGGDAIHDFITIYTDRTYTKNIN